MAIVGESLWSFSAFFGPCARSIQTRVLLITLLTSAANYLLALRLQTAEG